MMRNIIKSPVVLLVVICLFSSLVFAERWYETYERAIELIDDGNFGAAVSILNRLIAQEPSPKAGRRAYGTKYIDYFPYYYLGLCHYELKNYSQAISWLERSNQEGEIRESKDLYSRLNSMLSDGKQRVSASNQNTSTTTTTPVVTPTSITPTATTTVQPTATVKTSTTVLTSTELQNAQRQSRINNAIRDGRREYDRGNYSAAKTAFNKALKEDSANKEARQWITKIDNAEKAERYVNSGKDYEKSGDYSSAIKMYKQAQNLQPENKTLDKLIRDARSNSERAASQQKQKEAEALVDNAIEDYKAGDLVNSKLKFERALRIDPENSRAKYQLGEINKKLQAASGSDKMKDEIREYIDGAKQALDQKDYSSARTYYNKANALDSTNEQVRGFYKDFKVVGRDKINIGLKYYLAGDLEKATDTFLEALPAYEDSAGMNAFLGLVYFSRYRLTGEQDANLLSSAEVYMKKVSELDPEYSFSKKIFDPTFIEYYSRFQ
ncbi:MAG: hypothetical protein JW737_01720 [Acidobacteria bacterium]|nr:hypothetical protein [Acidobacteriota bacterium]